MSSSPASSAVADATRRGPVIAWSLWDWGSAAFNAVIVTFVFSVYLTDSVGDDLSGPVSASSWLGWSVGAASLVIAVLAPVMGQRSDASGHRKRSLALLTLSVVVTTALMFLVEDSPSYLWLGLVLIAVGTVLFELAQVPYFSMLRQVSTPETVGRVSGVGWAFGYLGGIVLLIIVYVGLISGDGGLLGVSTDNGLNIRWVAVVAAVWFLVFSIPVLFAVPELPADASPVPNVGFRESYRVLFAEIRTMWRDDRHVLQFLIASALFRDGLAGVFTFGAVIAVSVYGFTDDTVIPFGIAANVAAAAGAIVAGRLDDRLGPRRVIVFSLLAMLGAGAILLFLDGMAAFWVFGLVLCLFVGPAQSASRTYLVRLTPPGKEGQHFGLYAMTGRAASFLAPTLFGLFAFALGDDRWGIIGIMLVLLVGLLALLKVPPLTGDRASSPATV
ncbi:MFS transporter [Aeromicrobium fastidiosum]|uniref:MFS transporter n=1 Tax=Aeromicrobium fastidiosum TaxID=52699 RepID=A0A641AKS4_9ACTN|nr:MFS transporter [Aeromicrobium fastidiosum]KAA1376280.1 MFS transporter [Aeromicrobium fastidiosum]MBP2391824.1 UMF1 family MFS transporter [Aeromicrobium fastidiosum]